MFKEIYYTKGDFFFKVINAKFLKGVYGCCIKVNSFFDMFQYCRVKILIKNINKLFKLRKQALKFKQIKKL